MTTNGGVEKRIFVAHPRALTYGPLVELKAQVTALARQLKTREGLPCEPIVTLGRDDFEANAETLGGWDAWCKNVATGIDYVSREPRFHAIIVAPAPEVGKATAQIIRAAFAASKPVLVIEPGGAGLIPAQRIVQHDPRDFRAGWRVEG